MVCPPLKENYHESVFNDHGKSTIKMPSMINKGSCNDHGNATIKFPSMINKGSCIHFLFKISFPKACIHYLWIFFFNS
jgi:hypothetical protein